MVSQQNKKAITATNSNIKLLRSLIIFFDYFYKVMQNQEKPQAQFEESQSQSRNIKELKLENAVSSEFYSMYQSHMSNYKIDRTQALARLEQQDIKYNPNGFQDFNYKIKQEFLNYQILRITGKIGNFQLDLHILNEAINNPLTFYENSINGSNGEVYLIQFLKENIAIKSIKITNQNFAPLFQHVLKEMCILKICQALGCSLKSQKYLGFDLIVYNDCIQFSMSQGDRKSQNTQLLDNIKYELALMHSFHIIHCDIKPDNIMFCPAQNKYVFIDFGLSQFVQEDCGFKSKTYFKGTPEFGSPEMVTSLFSCRQHYIDLYFNDYFGLQKSILQKAEQNKNQQEQFPDFSYYFHQNSSQKMNLPLQYNDIENRYRKNYEKLKEDIQYLYMACAFKFYYISNDVAKLTDILIFKDNFLSKRSSKQLLIFIKELYFKIFIPKIFYLYFNCFEISDQYRQIQNLIKISKETIIIQKILQGNQNQVKNCQFFNRYFQIDMKKKTRYEKNVNFELIFDYLKISANLKTNKLNFQSKQVILNIFLQSLRFDKFNLKFQKKLQLSVIFKFLIGFSTAKSTHIPSIEDIKAAFAIMADYLAEQQFKQWKIEKGFDVFYQMIIIGININSQLINYIGWVKTQICKIEDKFILAMEIENICILISIKIITPSNKQLIGLFQFLNKQKHLVIQEMFGQASQDQLSICLCSIARAIANRIKLSQQQCQYFQIITSHIKNHKLKRLTKQFLKSCKIIQCLWNPYALNIYKEIKQLLQQNQNFLKSFAISSQLLFYTCYQEQLNKLDNSIKSLIDSKQIYQTFKFEYYSFIYNTNDNNHQLLSKYLHMLLQSSIQMNQISLMSKALLHQLFGLLFKVKDSQQFQKQNKEIIKQVYFKYVYSNCFWTSPQYKYHQIISSLEILFASAIPNLLNDPILKRLQSLRRDYLQSEQAYLDNRNPQNKQRYLKIQRQIMMYQQYLETKEQCSIQYLNCKEIQKTFENQQFNQLISIQTSYIKIMELYLKDSKQQLHFYLHKISVGIISKDKIGLYFQPCYNLLLNFIIQHHIYKGQLQRIYQILEKLVIWIANNILESFLQTFIRILKYVSKIQKFIFNYAQLQQNILQFKQKLYENPYYCFYLIYSANEEKIQTKTLQILKLISLNLSHLTTFAKRYLLTDFYAGIINLQMIPNRKKIYLLKIVRGIDKKQERLLACSLNFRKRLNERITNKDSSNKCCKKLRQNTKYILI